jgi:Domain of unknown function (DUF4190)
MAGIIGWRADPFGVHEERFFNPGNIPTELVRDNGNESFDQLPEPYKSHPQPLLSDRSSSDLPSVIPDRTGLSPTSAGAFEGTSIPETYAFCTSCGTKAAAHSSFCAACGHSLLKESTDVGFSAASQEALADSSSKSPDPPAVTWTMEAANGPLLLAHSPDEYAVYDNQRTYGRWPKTEEGHRLAAEFYRVHAQPPPPPPPPPTSNVGPHQRTNSTAIVAFVFAFLFWPLGIILGHVARHSIRRSGERGGGLALAALIISYIWGAAVIVIVIAVIAAPSSSGFNNLSTLQNSVTQQVNNNLNNSSNAAYSPGTSATSALCVHNSGTQYSCVVTLSNGTRLPVSVTVSEDGSRWVSNG